MHSIFTFDSSPEIRRFTVYYALSGLTFTLPIWVAFYLRIIPLEQLAFINGTANLISVALQIPTGALADLVGRKIMIFSGLSIRALAFLGLPFVGSFNALFLLNIFMAIGESMGSGADTALLYDTLKREGRETEFGATYAKILLFYRIGLIFGSLFGGISYSLWFGTPYLMRGVAILLSAYIISKMFEPTLTKSGFNLKGYLEKTKYGMSELVKTIFVRKLTLYYVLVGGITWSCMYYFNQPFAYDFGWSTEEMSVITALAYLASSLSILFLTSHPKLLTRQRVYLGFPLIMIIALTPGLFVGRWMALVLMTIAQLAGSARFSILDRYVNMEFDSKYRATAISSLNMLVSLTMAGLIFGGGYIQSFSDTRMVYTILGILSFIFVLPMALILLQDHQQYKLKKGEIYAK